MPFDVTSCVICAAACCGQDAPQKRRIAVCVHVNEKRAGQVFTFEPVTEDVLQNGHKVDELWRRVIYCLGTAAVQQSLD